MSIITRWRYRWIMFMAGYEALARRVEVEKELFDMAFEKKPLPDKNKCRQLANKLGMPR